MNPTPATVRSESMRGNRLGMLAQARFQGGQPQPQGIGLPDTGPVGDWIEDHWGFHPGEIPGEDQQFGFDRGPWGNPAVTEPEPYHPPLPAQWRKPFKGAGARELRQGLEAVRGGQAPTFSYQQPQPAPSWAGPGYQQKHFIQATLPTGLTGQFNVEKPRQMRQLERLRGMGGTTPAPAPAQRPGLGALARRKGR